MAYKIIERTTALTVGATIWGMAEEILVAGTRVDVILAPGQALPGLRLDSNTADRIELDLVRSVVCPQGFSRLYLDWVAHPGGRLLLLVSGDGTGVDAAAEPRGPRFAVLDAPFVDGGGLEIPGGDGAPMLGGSAPWSHTDQPLTIDLGGDGLYVAVMVDVENSLATNPGEDRLLLDVSHDGSTWSNWGEMPPNVGAAGIRVRQVLQLPFRFVRLRPTGPLHGRFELSCSRTVS